MELEQDKQGDDVNVEPTDAISADAIDSSSQVKESVESGPPAAAASHETIPAMHSYQIKPLLQDKFKPGIVKEIIRTALGEKLAGKTYEADHVKKWTVELANDISAKVIELKMKRYKHIVQVILGEHKGAGVKSGVRCIWDSETDAYTSDFFSNDTIFCVVVVYAVYLY